MKNLSVLLVLMALFVGGCASVPMRTDADDRKAKEFKVPKGKAKIYVYRNESFGGAIKVGLTLNGKRKGKIAPKVYHMWTVDPGKYDIVCLAESDDLVSLKAKAGKAYFIWQEMKMGAFSAGCELHKVSNARGKKEIQECKLAF